MAEKLRLNSEGEIVLRNPSHLQFILLDCNKGDCIQWIVLVAIATAFHLGKRFTNPDTSAPEWLDKVITYTGNKRGTLSVAEHAMLNRAANMTEFKIHLNLWIITLFG